MTDKEKIKAEVERLLNKEWKWQSSIEGKYRCETYRELLEFIDSLQEEPVSEYLEEAATQYGLSNPIIHFTADGIEKDAEIPMCDFIAGAKWQKQQIMKDSEPAEVGYWNQRGLSIHFDKSLERLGLEEDDKVKVLIIREDK